MKIGNVEGKSCKRSMSSTKPAPVPSALMSGVPAGPDERRRGTAGAALPAVVLHRVVPEVHVAAIIGSPLATIHSGNS
jgi:hypothetical protein